MDGNEENIAVQFHYKSSRALPWFSEIPKEMVQYYCDSVVRATMSTRTYGRPLMVKYSRGEVLNCTRETGNAFDPFAVSVIKRGNVVGHVPRNISAICSLFMRCGGMIHCKVTGSRQYSHDISQGGLEFPCLLIFTGDPKYIQKVKKAMSSASAAAKSKVATSESSKEVGGNDEVKMRM